MAAVSTIVAGVALAATAVAGYQQYKAAGEAADAQKEGQEIGAASQQIERRRGSRQALREERIRRAKIMQAAENVGTGGSSSQFGSTGALGTLTGSKVGAMAGQGLAAKGMSAANQRGVDARSSASMWGSVGQASGSIFSAAGGFDQLGQAFGSSGGGGGSPVKGGFQSQVFTIDQGTSIFGG